jgi:hypothetical protein
MLQQFLNKLGVKGYEDLNQEEKQVFQQYQEVLTKEVTVADIKTLVKNQIDAILISMAEYSNDSRKEMYLKARLRDMMMIKALLEAPDKAKENLKQVIKGLYESKA